MPPTTQHKNRPLYSDDPVWADVIPIPLAEGPGPGAPLASISYTPRYATAMSYLRAVMAANEYSMRALSLTEDIISMNPAHYTVWLYRAKMVRELDLDVEGELAWLEGVAGRSLKNYQIWHHRQKIISSLAHPPSSEPAFLSRILSLDSKNYHVWTYRQWLVSHFNLFDSPSELAAVETLLRDDVRNNSAWNHRWFLCFGREELARSCNINSQKHRQLRAKGGSDDSTMGVVDEDLIDREVNFVQAKVRLAPQNQSPWLYLRGLYRKSGRPLSELRDFAEEFLGPGGDIDEGVRSSHALDLLAEIYGGDDEDEPRVGDGDLDKATRILEVLGSTWDPIRKGYWDYRIGLLGSRGRGQGLKESPVC